MKRSLIWISLAAAAPMAIAGCVDHGRYSVGMGWYSYPYSVWYDGYYGPFYDGYWGTDGYFYFRLSQDRSYRRAATGHFYRQQPSRARETYRHYEGSTRQPPRGVQTPNYPSRSDRDRSRSQPRDRDRDQPPR